MAATVEIVLAAKDNASSVFESAGSKLDSFGGKAAALAGGAVAGLAVGVAAVGKAAFDMASEVNQATNDIAAQLGMSKDSASEFEGVMTAVFANNFGENFDDIADGVIAMNQNLGEVPADAMQPLLEGAFAIRDAFGADLNDTMMSVNTLMDNFGITSQQALDMITAGFQGGLDTSGDFLDSINEYSTQFSNAGADAGQFFSVMESGMAGGMLGTDKAADAFKEFTVRIQDGSDSTAEALGAIGINTDELLAGLADGTVTAADAFDQVVAALNETEDNTTQFQAGVALLGTQFEDLGTSAALGLSTTTSSMEEMAGATESLNTQYESLGSAWEGITRQMSVALEPLGSALLDLANKAMPAVSEFVTGTLTPAIESLSEWLGNELPKAIEQASDFWTNTLQPAMQAVSDFIDGTLIPIVEQIRDVLTSSNDDMNTSTNETWNQILEIIKTTVDLIQAALEGLSEFWQAHGDTITKIASTAWDAIKEMIDYALDQIQNIIELALALLTGDWKRAWDEIKQIVDRAWQLIKTAITNAKPLIMNAVQTIIRAIKDAFKIDWSGIGKDMMDGVKSGITSKAGDLANAAKGAAGGALDSVKSFIKGKSPSQVWKVEVGYSMIDGVIEGIRERATQLNETVRGVIGDAQNVAVSMMPEWERIGWLTGERFGNAMEAALARATNQIAATLGTAIDEFGNALGQLLPTGNLVGTGVGAGGGLFTGSGTSSGPGASDDALGIGLGGGFPSDVVTSPGGPLSSIGGGVSGGSIPPWMVDPVRKPAPGGLTVNIGTLVGTDERAANIFADNLATQLRRESAF